MIKNGAIATRPWTVDLALYTEASGTFRTSWDFDFGTTS